MPNFDIKCHHDLSRIAPGVRKGRCPLDGYVRACGLQFGNIAHVFSTYEGTIEGEDHPMRGINSLQLMNDGKRWWIVSLMWEGENPKLSLPAQYLPATGAGR